MGGVVMCFNESGDSTQFNVCVRVCVCELGARALQIVRDSDLDISQIPALLYFVHGGGGLIVAGCGYRWQALTGKVRRVLAARP